MVGGLEYVLVPNEPKQVHFLLSVSVGLEGVTGKRPLQTGMEKAGEGHILTRKRRGGSA